MSGKPNEDGIKKLRDALRDFAWTRERIAELVQSIETSKKSLELREVELRGLDTLIKGVMAEMDVSSPGNHGWERRNFEMLLLLARN